MWVVPCFTYVIAAAPLLVAAPWGTDKELKGVYVPYTLQLEGWSNMTDLIEIEDTVKSVRGNKIEMAFC